jgi:hypothetical protein
VTVFKHFQGSLEVIVNRMVEIEVKNREDRNGVTLCAAEKVVRM